ncbi:MAG: N-acetylgalactosamine-6-sulfatase, partial [Thermoguttaceae bacterium]|nr:N-acetylgalactosamine-6-sulfatase [Thermoguttaceae bacterium]
MKYIPATIAMLLAVALALMSAPADAAGKPNIVYLLADQWRASAFGYTGDPNVKTPNLDRLAQQS